MSMVRTVIGGVDTHANFHVAAAIDSNGGLLGIESFGADAAGYEELLGWLAATPQTELGQRTTLRRGLCAGEL